MMPTTTNMQSAWRQPLVVDPHLSARAGAASLARGVPTPFITYSIGSIGLSNVLPHSTYDRVTDDYGARIRQVGSTVTAGGWHVVVTVAHGHRRSTVRVGRESGMTGLRGGE